MAHIIPVAHDFTCPWCWIGHFQVQRLKAMYDVEFDWMGYELWPEELGWPEPGPEPTPPPANRPATLSRLDFAYLLEGIDKPTVLRPKRMRIRAALQAVEFAKTVGRQSELVSALYEAYWMEGKAIGEVSILKELAEGILPDPAAMAKSIEAGEFVDKIVMFDDDAYAVGVYNVPTFFIGEERKAEMPWMVLADSLEKAGVQRR